MIAMRGSDRPREAVQNRTSLSTLAWTIDNIFVQPTSRLKGQPGQLEAIPTRTNDHKVVLKFIKEHIFSRFGVPRAIISDGGLHFCNRSIENMLKKYGVTHKVSTAYHPQTNG